MPRTNKKRQRHYQATRDILNNVFGNDKETCLDVETDTELRFIPEPVFITRLGKRKQRGVRAAGIKYECDVQEYLSATYGGGSEALAYLPSPWIELVQWEGSLTARSFYYQPDGLLFDFALGKVIIIEVKLRHTPTAWTQVRECYEPLIERLFPRNLWQVAVCEIVRWYDPHTSFPEDVTLVEQPHRTPVNTFGVHIFGMRDVAKMRRMRSG